MADESKGGGKTEMLQDLKQAVHNVEEKNNKAQLWVIAAMIGLFVSIGSYFLSSIDKRITRLETEMPREMKAMVLEHESRPHRDAVQLRDWNELTKRLDRIESKIDQLGK